MLIGLVLIGTLYIFAQRTNKTQDALANNQASKASVNNASILENAKIGLTAEQKISLLSIENELVKSKSKADSLHVYHELAAFWTNTAHKAEPYFYYTYLAALLENSEKSLTFAAQLLVDNLTSPEAPPEMQP